MNCFGVCNYDFDAHEPKIVNLEKFDSWEEAFEEYIKRMKEDPNYPHTWDNSRWIAWVEDDQLVQFTQLSFHTRCRIVKEENNGED